MKNNDKSKNKIRLRNLQVVSSPSALVQRLSKNEMTVEDFQVPNLEFFPLPAVV